MGVLSAVLVVALSIPLVLFFRSSETANLRLGMERDALVLATDLSALPTSAWPDRLDAYQQETGARLTVVNGASRVVFDTEGANPGSNFTRPEMARAIAGQIAAGTRESATLGQQLNFVAVPIQHGEETIGALRLSMPASLVEAKVRQLELGLVAALVLVLLLAVITAWVVARVLSRPLRRLADGARRVGADPSSRVGDIAGPHEVQDIADALDETASRLQGSIERSQAVAEEASHHLRTPLAAMRLRIEAVADETEGQSQLDAEAALTEVDRLTRRVDQVLAIATTEAGAVPVVADIGLVVDRDLAGWQAVASQRGIELLCTYESALVTESPGSVERTVDELLGNAFSYARSRVEVEVLSDGGFGILRVSDDGTGIPEDEQDSVFERFARGASARPGGTGLGLAMVREAVRAVGGDAHIRSSEAGTTVEVTWPLAPSGD
jgi:signal transduction histidine kinase